MSTKTIRIKVDKSGAQRALNEINKALGGVGLKAELGGSAFTGMAGKAAMAGTAVAAVGAAAIIASKQVLDFARSSALAVTEMERGAKLARMSTDDFQAMAFATETVGVNQGKLADILKDVNDKLGDFISTGGGEFKDVFEVALRPMGITIEKLKEMSSADVLLAVQQGMEATGRSGKEMTFVLEAIANDASLLSPLLEDNGKQLKELDAKARKLGLIIPPEQVEAAKKFNAEYVILNKQFETFKNLIGTQLIPYMETVTKWLAEAAHWADQFWGITAQGNAKKLANDIADVEASISQLNKSTYAASDPDSVVSKQIRSAEKKLALLKEEKIAADALAKSQLKGFAYNGVGKDVAPNSVAPSDVNTYTPTGGISNSQLESQKEAAAAYLEVIAQRNMDEFALLDAKQATETEKLNEFREVGAISDAEHKAAMLELEQSYADQVYAIIEAEDQKEADLAAKKKDREKKDAQDKAKTELHWQKQISTTNKDMARESLSLIASTAKEGSAIRVAALIAEKALAISQVITQYEVASAMAMAQLGPIAGAPVAATMRAQAIASSAIIAAQGVVEMSRQSGGYMQANTPYQVGGGAHTNTPEMYQSGGKSYIVDSQAGMMKRVSGNATSGGGAINMQLINNGEPMSYTMKQDSVDEQGVRNIVMEMTPQILREQAGNDQSDFSKAFGSIRNQDWSFN